MIKARITKEEVNALPLIDFSGKIHLIDTHEKAMQAKDKFQGLLSSVDAVGLDTESRPSFKKTDNFKICLIQVSFESECFLFRLNLIDTPLYLIDFLEDESVAKVGVAVKDDSRDLRKQHKIEAKGILDVQDLAKAKGYITLGLQSLTGILLEKKISKKAKLTNWENKVLTPSQINYAATDAWISLKLYQELV